MASTALDDLVDLLSELRDPSAGVMSRANVARKLFQLVAGLQPLERRELMLEVASRAAPDLAERLLDATGVEITSQQLTALAEALDGLEPEDVDALVDRLADPEQRREAAEDALRGSGVAVASAVGLDVDDAEPPATAADETEPIDELATLEAPVGALEEPEESEELEEAEEADEPGPDDQQLTDEQQSTDGQQSTDEHGVGERSWFTGRPLGIAPVDEGTRISERVAQASSAGASLRAFRGLLGEIADLPGESQAETLRAIPDGWARRRALESLIRAGAVARRDIPALLRTLSGRWPRTWVVGTLLEEDMIDVDQLDELVDPETAGRLRRRAELTGG